MLTLEGLVYRSDDFSLSADFAVPPGARVAVIGPSGSGKSTLLDMIAGFLAPVQGRVLWQGNDLTRMPPGDRPISLLFQDNNLFPHLTVAQNVGLGLRPDLRLSADQRAAVGAALARVGLAGYEARKPAALSGGQRSRVALARVLLRARPLMLLDEPFAALGPALRAEMLMLVRELADETGATVLMVTHDPRDARALGDQTVLVAGGLAHPPQPTEALFNDPPPALRAYLG
ncbi:thiamine ABC transporter ATP-binding protein [Actibacterium sp. XHP0104]|uniref:thiamine ABC transporter ATP-binding protein n=1 Tax=Actibacterium sp. XHP0104 TaxID=2984335 RepID=UPI0021E7A3E1|nr:thiamine ABC transporter ATP-binding protein [Actibacterium sp. XHP0104]MCV2882004.1 thiamine ABC transporter ATP-binding protein [Actibacterium sp. XHP0104]